MSKLVDKLEQNSNQSSNALIESEPAWVSAALPDWSWAKLQDLGSQQLANFGQDYGIHSVQVVAIYQDSWGPHQQI